MSLLSHRFLKQVILYQSMITTYNFLMLVFGEKPAHKRGNFSEIWARFGCLPYSKTLRKINPVVRVSLCSNVIFHTKPNRGNTNTSCLETFHSETMPPLRKHNLFPRPPIHPLVTYFYHDAALPFVII